MKTILSKYMLQNAVLIASMTLSAAGQAADVAAPKKPEAAQPPKVEASGQAEADDQAEDGDEAKKGPKDGEKAEGQKPEPKVIPKSAASKALENRLSFGTSVGWAVVKPAKGTWIGVGAADLGFQWRSSPKEDSKLFITGRYAPFAGVWTVDRRDYDTTLHGLYGGAELQVPTKLMGASTLKAGVELGYMLVYARPQDKAEASSAVKGGKVNLTGGAGADWSILSNKVKVGPFARVHVAGFSIVNVGGSARFVF